MTGFRTNDKDQMTIKIKVSKKGRKMAYRYHIRSMRSFPMPIKDAEWMILTGQAVEVDEL